MEVLATTPSAPSAAIEKPQQPDEGFSQVLHKATADIAPPGTPPPNKGTNQAREVAGTEQKTPPQQPDSKPDQGKTATQTADQNPALLVSMARTALSLKGSKAPSTPTDQAQAAQAQQAQEQAKAAADSQNQTTDAATASATAAAGDEAKTTDATLALAQATASKAEEVAEDAKAPQTTGDSIQGIAHPDLGKVRIKLQKIADQDADASEIKEGDSEGEPVPISAPSASGNEGSPTDPSMAGALAVVAPKPLSPTAASASVQPLSNEHRDLVYKQVSDRMELLAATRPKDAVTIHLQPPDLGNVTVILKTEGAQMSAEFFATHDGVREALKEDSGKLTAQLQTKGYGMSHIAVSQASQPQQTGSNTHYRDRQNPTAQQGNPDASGQQRNRRDSRRGNFVPSSLKESSASSSRMGSRGLGAVDFSV